MSEYTYTAEDFEQAEFAIDPREDHPRARRWVRFYVNDFPWKNGHGVWRTSADMAAERCIPVYAEPYSPEALQRAWEHGEKPKPGEKATKGVVSLELLLSGRPQVYVNEEGDALTARERIIYRPPAPDPDVVTLKEILGCWPAGLDLDGLAEFLHEHGVKAVTGDD